MLEKGVDLEKVGARGGGEGMSPVTDYVRMASSANLSLKLDQLRF